MADDLVFGGSSASKVRATALGVLLMGGAMTLPGCSGGGMGGGEPLPPPDAAQRCTDQATAIAKQILKAGKEHDGPGFFSGGDRPTERDKFMYLEEQERARCLREEALRAQRQDAAKVTHPHDSVGQTDQPASGAEGGSAPPTAAEAPAPVPPSASSKKPAYKIFGEPAYPLEDSETVKKVRGFGQRVMDANGATPDSGRSR